MRKASFTLLCSILLQFSYAQDKELNIGDVLKPAPDEAILKAIESNFLPRELMWSLCLEETPATTEATPDPSKKEETPATTETTPDPSKKEETAPPVTDEKSTTTPVYDYEKCFEIYNSCEGRLNCIIEIAPELGKRIGKRAGGTRGDGRDWMKVVRLFEKLSITITGIDKKGNVTVGIADNAGRIVYLRKLPVVARRVVSSAAVKSSSVNNVLKKLPAKLTPALKLQVYKAVFDKFSFSISSGKTK